MTVFYLDENTGKRNTAGSKAPTDISTICQRMGFTPLKMPTIILEQKPKLRHLEEAVKLSFFWKSVLNSMEEGDVFIYQHPTLGKPIAYKGIKKLIEEKRVRIISVIHDLESLRGGISGQIKVNTAQVNSFEDYLLHNSSSIISHNQKMGEYIISLGIAEEKIVNLGIFDYLDGTHREKYEKTSTPSIAIAGNLSYQKSGYLYSICDDNVNQELKVHLYGKYFDSSKVDKSNITYHGSFSPEELGKIMEGDFGLVWDGPSITSCEGNTGNYLRYNNPHKASMYLSAGMPIITWSQAAIADFVVENRIGIVVDNLKDIQKVISQISTEEYSELCNNVNLIAEKLRNGYYFSTAIKQALKHE